MSTLYRKYRPQAWAEVSGQNHVKVTLGFQVATGKIAHAYLFSGPRGVGKTTAARIFSRAVNCIGRSAVGSPDAGEPCGTCESCTAIMEGRTLDVIEIDAASHRGIDAVRENIIENARFSPSRLTYKVFIIDEVHMLTNEAFNALLKTLEEPPAHAVFILATTELHKVPQTILSRCQRFEFRKIPFADLVDRLHRLSEREKVKMDRRTLEEIARHADGSLRDAESLLGKVLTMGDGKRVTYDEALTVLPRSDARAVAAFVDALLHHDARSAVLTVGDCLEGGTDLDQFATDAIELLRKTLLAKMSGSPDVFSAEMDEESKQQLIGWAALAGAPELVFATETLMEKRREIKSSHPAQLPLELAAVRICEGIRQWSASPAAPSMPPAAGGGTVPGSRVATAPAVPGSFAAAKVPGTESAKKADPTPTPEEQPIGATITLESRKEEPEEEKAAILPVMEVAADTAARIEEQPVEAAENVTTVDRVKAAWGRFVAKAGELNASLPYVLGVGTPMDVSGAMVRIGFDFAFHRDKLNQEKNRRLIEEALGAVLGVAVRVEGVLLEKKSDLGHDDAATGEDSLAQPQPALAGNVLQAFGGRVVE